MNATVAKFAPTAVILAASGACAWPHLGGSEPDTPPPAAAPGRAGGPEISLALLRPARVPRPDRDPFQDPEVVRNEARARLALLLKRLVRPRAAPGRAVGVAGAAGAVAGSKPAAAKAAEIDPREGLVLSATSAHERRGAAVINGRVYLTGDPVPCARSVEPCVLAAVRVDQVVLRHRGSSYPLGYPALAAASGRRSAPGADRAPARRPLTRKSGPPKK